MYQQETFVVSELQAHMRLDQLLAQHFPHHSRTYFHYLIENHAVLVNGKCCKKKERLHAGDTIQLSFLMPPAISLEAEEIPLEILYEDEEILAINKPSSMVVHPAAGHPNQTFVNALLFHCEGIEKSDANDLRPGIVHRLDKGTTGVLLAAKTRKMHAELIELFSQRKIQKRYLAICLGNPPQTIIDAPIGRDPQDRKKMKVVEVGGREAISSLQSLQHNEQLSLVEIFPKTGRTHQIRVHLKHLGFPILGDPSYGFPSANKKYQVARPLLHAASVCFTHPRTLQTLEIQAPPPADFLKWMHAIRLQS